MEKGQNKQLVEEKRTIIRRVKQGVMIRKERIIEKKEIKTQRMMK